MTQSKAWVSKVFALLEAKKAKRPLTINTYSCAYLQSLVQHNKLIRGKIPEILQPLMVPHCEKVDEMLSPGLTLLPWTSLNLAHFAESCTRSLDNLDLLISRVTDILEIQIEGELRDITSTLLCDLPDNEPWTIEEFISRIKV